MANIRVSRPVEVTPTSFGRTADLYTAIAVLCRKVTGQDGNFLHHIVVQAHDAAAVTANVNHARTVYTDAIAGTALPVHRVVRRPAKS